MARARNIKPSFFQNEQLGELSPIERLFFIGLWTVADYKGCVELRPKRLKIQLLPYDDCDIEEIANNLDKSGLIRKYSVQGIQYMKVVNFERHQNPHKNEREAGSDIPDIPLEASTGNESRLIQNNQEQDGTAPADSLLLIPDSLLPIKEPLSGKPDDAVEVLNFLNVKTDHQYQPVDANLKLIRARFKEGATMQDMKMIIAMKRREWKDKEEFAKYLRPATLFDKTKFWQYHGQLLLQEAQ